MPLSVIAPGAATISALHTDNIGTVQRATNSAKTVVWTGNYDPNGAVTPTTTIIMNLRQLGVLSDVSGDYHNGFRDRVPGTIPGYLQSDPLSIAPWIVSPTSQGNPNTYPWLGYNPYNRIDPWGLDVTVILYRGAGGAGHVGLGVAPHGQTVAPGQTLGFYPATYNLSALLGGTPGSLQLDAGHTPMQGVPNTIVIPTTPAQDAAITAYLDYLRSHGEYVLGSGGAAQNCATAVEHSLAAGGVSTSDTIVPLFLMQSLQSTYGQKN